MWLDYNTAARGMVVTQILVGARCTAARLYPQAQASYVVPPYRASVSQPLARIRTRSAPPLWLPARESTRAEEVTRFELASAHRRGGRAGANATHAGRHRRETKGQPPQAAPQSHGQRPLP